jgi:hypothetical protein
VNEAQWQRRITDLCDVLGLKWHHETDSRRSKSGYPDLSICGHGFLFAELKTERGKVSPEQQDWIDRLRHAGVEVYVWRPSDWDFVRDRLVRLAGKRLARVQ